MNIKLKLADELKTKLEGINAKLAAFYAIRTNKYNISISTNLQGRLTHEKIVTKILFNEKMKYTPEDGIVYKSKKYYWIALYPTRENDSVQVYLRRIKMKVDSKYKKQINKNSRIYTKK